MNAHRYDVIVLGAGAAGMMCAFEAGRRGRRVLLLDHGERVGRKILISGGGRCNFTNLHTRAENFLSANPHFAKSALARFTPADMIALVEKHGIRYHEKTLGQLFCDDSAQRIVALLERECGDAGVETRCGVKVIKARQENAAAVASKFVVETSAGDFAAESVVVATGGLSIPKMGATSFGYELAQQFGHALIEPRAALVPLVFAPEDRERWCDLSGVSFEVVARAETTGKTRRKVAPEFREKLLITHRGVSGPAVLQVSSYWKPGEQVCFDLAPGREVLAALLEKNARRDAANLVAALRAILPARMAERWVAAQLTLDWTNAGIARMEAALHAWTLTPAGTEGFAKAEVTAGGIDTAELDARTMESRRVPGLYFIGEVVDVTGWLGGYNFQWAWASAVSAGQAV
ncbi:NAD(P)/FAD-dependent oxidoreductase [Granulicella sp. S156]|uniref:NAD(P)/FAD-dependent oxidoreductase n=1 Tax=Granulicella sp. S156 TaxID=1747224 RepID=UPI00131DBFF7|nr:NAD(P)/FAD-dependent oxidoreductase [Granulicella sp. S156]